jgi:hypothetical protein
MAWGLFFAWVVSQDSENFLVYVGAGVAGVAFLHIVFTGPIGRKLAEDQPDG